MSSGIIALGYKKKKKKNNPCALSTETKTDSII